MLRFFVSVVCAVSPDLITDKIPPACGRNPAHALCQWAQLTEERFMDLALAIVKETHQDESEDPDAAPGLLRNITPLASQGLNEEEITIELTKRYYRMITKMKECQPYM